MNLGKVLVFGFLLTLIGFMVWSLFLPKTYSVERSVEISKSAEATYQVLIDLKHYKKWNPWTQKEPEAKQVVSGEAGKVGQVFSWDGQKIGAGSLSIIDLFENRGVQTRVMFLRPASGRSISGWELRKKADGVEVIWRTTGKLGWPGGRIWGLSADQHLGPDQERGLQAFKEYVETMPDLKALAKKYAQEKLILDGHVDLPYRLYEGRGDDGKISEDISKRTKGGDFDYVRAKEGGLDAPFMSIYVPARHNIKQSKVVADELIDMVEDIAKSHPDKFQIAKSSDEVLSIKKDGKVALPMGMENGAGIGKKLEHLKHFYDRGIRYITLAHSEDNHLADSSYSEKHTNKGLSKWGKKAVAEMNKLGIMVDLSHLSDQAAEQVLDISKAPVIASHSSCRKFTPKFERNISDNLLQKLQKNGGVVQINFGSMFLDGESQRAADHNWDLMTEELKKNGIEKNSEEEKLFREKFWKEHPTKKVSITVVADHIDHVKKLIGVDHVGLGSDFDGVGDSLPIGLEDVSKYPNLIDELLKRGYTEEELEKLLSGNVLRVWREVEKLASAEKE